MPSHNILLVEDSPEIQIVVRAILKAKYDLTIAATIADGAREIAANTYSLIILDVTLPDGDGFNLCAQAKLTEKNRHTPVVFLSGRQAISDKVMGLSIGGEDYITKPIDKEEFLARVDARIRSLEQNRTRQETLRAGLFRIEMMEQRVYLEEKGTETALDLSALEFKIFSYLFRHQDQVLSREQILKAVWGQSISVTDRTVDTHIYNLRQKLGANSAVIQSVPRVGYRLALNEKKQAA